MKSVLTYLVDKTFGLRTSV